MADASLSAPPSGYSLMSVSREARSISCCMLLGTTKFSLESIFTASLLISGLDVPLLPAQRVQPLLQPLPHVLHLTDS